ncbi:MAG TPA: NrfD/PsrC family molybdoenzyme membrane anchor subunit [Gaiellales bacterium]|nr:NrfD/PsrC family molybdoenzyme membrane anchor subunit [Gaiellales bacterium]
MTDPAYYGRPIVKPPVWKREIGWYLFTGGLAGASSTMAALARASGNPVLARRAALVATGAVNVSPALLVKDLGRPERFLNMMRVFRPSSPMNVGSWLLLGEGAAASAATLLDLAGVAPRLRTALEMVAGAGGLALSVYTAVLLADTANPAWHEGRRELPFLFAAGAAASAGAAGVLVTPREHAGPARRAMLLGTVGSQAAETVMERRIGPVAGAYSTGEAGRYRKAARILDGAGVALSLTSGRRSRKLGAALALAGAVASRFTVFKAGFQAAEDPRYVLETQRDGRREAVGGAAR